MKELKRSFLAASARCSDLGSSLKILPTPVSRLVRFLYITVGYIQTTADYLYILPAGQGRKLVLFKVVVNRGPKRLVSQNGTMNFI
jgi:hypothetical protein